MKSIRGVLMAAAGYKMTGVTRDDIFNKTSKGKETMAKLGIVSLQVLKKELSPRLATRP